MHSKANRELDVQSDVEAAGLLWAAALANDAALEETGEAESRITYRMVGDPTEGALIVAAAKAGLWRSEIWNRVIRAWPKCRLIPIASA